MLPPELLDHIFWSLDARSVARVACVSKDWASAAARAPLRLGLTHATDATVFDWVSRQRYSRVVSCVASRGVFRFPTPCFEALEILKYTFCRVPIRVLGTFPRTLRRLDIHRLVGCRGAVFGTGRMLGPFSRLEHASITFFPEDWQVVCIDGGPVSLRSLRLRQCPCDVFVVSVPPNVTDLCLESLDAISTTRSAFLFTDVERYDMSCRILSSDVFPESLTSLRVHSPASDVSLAMWKAVCALPRLMDLVLVVECATLDAIPSALTRLDLSTRRLATVAWPPHITINATYSTGGSIPHAFFLEIPYVLLRQRVP